MEAWYRNQYAAMLAGTAVGYGGVKLMQNADTVVPVINDTLGAVIPTSIEAGLSTFAAPYVVGRAAAKMIPQNRPLLRAGVATAAGAATLAAPSYVSIPLLSTLVSLWAANKAVQWGGLNREVYKSMEEPGAWNLAKRHVISTPGKIAMGFFYSGWNPALHDDLRWQERIGAVVPQLARGLVRPFYTPWEKLQGFEAVPGALIRPVVSAASTIWNALPGSDMFKSPDKFGEGVGNIALAPFRAPGYVWGKMKDFWKWGTSDPSAKK